MQAFLRQASSDFAAYRALAQSGLPSCHALHELQMALEKLAKAIALGGSPGGFGRTHVAWSKISGALGAHSHLAGVLGMKTGDYRRFISRIHPIGRAIEELHPQVPTSGVPDGANAEYPWRSIARSRSDGWIAPADHEFSVESRLRSADGAMMLKLVGVLLTKFDKIF